MSQQGSEEKKSDISLHIDQQAPQVKAAIEAIRDSYKDRLDAIKEHKASFDQIYTSVFGPTDACVPYGINQGRLMIISYLNGIGLGPSIDLKDTTDDLEVIFKLKGIFNSWYVKEVASLQKSLNEDLNKLIDRMKA